DGLLGIGTVGSAFAATLFGLSGHAATAVLASLIAGLAWIAALSSLNVSAQVALPEWVRGRGLAVFVTVFFGTMSLGSVLWGELATWVGVSTALLVAAAGAVVALPLTWRWKLQTGA